MKASDRGLNMNHSGLTRFILCFTIFIFLILASETARGQRVRPLIAGEEFPSITPDFELPAEDLDYLGLSNKEKFSFQKINADLILLEILNVYCPNCEAQAPIFNKLYLFAPKIRLFDLSPKKIWKNKPVIYASNHKCFADFCFISSFIKGAFTILIRSDLMKNIFFKFITWKMGFISIDRSNILSQLKALNKAKKRITKQEANIYHP